jgi:cell division protein FtsQ
VLFLLIVIVAVATIFGIEAFRLREIVVVGLVEQPESAVTRLADLTTGDSVFGIDFKKTALSIEQSPYFDVEAVSLLFPDRVLIKLRERVPMAVLSFGKTFVVVDEEGTALRDVASADKLGLPRVTGLSATGYSVAEKIDTASADKLDALCALLYELKWQDARFLVSEIDMTDIADMKLKTTNGFSIRLGEARDMEKKVQWLRTTLPLLLEDGYDGGMLSVSDTTQVFFSPA